jgi:hypothetical protein
MENLIEKAVILIFPFMILVILVLLPPHVD